MDRGRKEEEQHFNFQIGKINLNLCEKLPMINKYNDYYGEKTGTFH